MTQPASSSLLYSGLVTQNPQTFGLEQTNSAIALGSLSTSTGINSIAIGYNAGINNDKMIWDDKSETQKLEDLINEE